MRQKQHYSIILMAFFLKNDVFLFSVKIKNLNIFNERMSA